MRILVFGAGAIGSLIGWTMAGAGHEVSHYVRRRSTRRLAHGFDLDLLDGRHKPPATVRERYVPRLVTSHEAPSEHELLIVSVGHSALPDALPRVVAVAGDAPVLFLMDLWTGGHEVDAALPRRRFLWGLPNAMAAFDRSGQSLRAALQPGVRLGAFEGQPPDDLYRRVAEALAAAGQKPHARPDMEHWLRVRFAIEAGLAGAALQAGGAAALLADRAAMRRAVLAVRDALRVCERLGADVRTFHEVVPFYLSIGVATRLIPAMLARNPVTARMAEIFGERRDVGAVFHDVLRTGRELDVEMPHLEALEAAVPRPADEPAGLSDGDEDGPEPGPPPAADR